MTRETTTRATDHPFSRAQLWAWDDEPDTTPLEVVVDDREEPSGVIEKLMSHEAVKIVHRRLELGDYLVANRVLVERKTIADLSASIVDGRLFRQACRLSEGVYRSVMVIEGHIRADGASGVRRQAIQGAMVTLALFLGIPCLRTLDAEETANLLCYIAEQTHRRVVRAVCRHGYRPRRRRNRQLFILQGLPGVGPARAERLLQPFGSVEGAFRADLESLSHVEGMGEKTARAIRDLIGPDERDRDEIANVHAIV